MPAPAPKPISGIIQRISKLFDGERRDIERLNLEREIDGLKNSDPAGAFICLAALAALDKDEPAMRDYFDLAFNTRERLPEIYYNMGMGLLSFGHIDEAVDSFNKCLDLTPVSETLLNDTARHAISLDNGDLCQRVLEIANKQKITSQPIIELAAYVGTALSDDADEIEAMLNAALPDDTLRKNSILVTDEMWAQMQALADKIRPYA